MTFAQFLFKLLTSAWSILVVNSYLVALIVYDLSSAFSGQTRLELIELRGEDISDIVVAWAVLLESREFFVSGSSASPEPRASGEALLNSQIARSGLVLLALGVLLQMVTYFDFDVQTKFFSVSVSALFNLLEWVLLALLGLELLVGSWSVAKALRRSSRNERSTGVGAFDKPSV